MRGTAVPARRFLLVEHHGPWPFDALAAAGLDPDVRTYLQEATRASGARPLLIRRHGRLDPTGDRRWAVADVVTGRIRWGTWSRDHDLRAAGDALAEPSTDWSSEPVLLVCTHGNHDTCCAVRGRPVAEALTESHPELSWECSHVGGDRFAASVVVLPDGTYYGGLDASEAPDVVRQHLAGTVTPGRLRGSSMLPVVAQAVAAEVHDRHGPGGPRDIVTQSVESVGDGRWQVELACSGHLPARVLATVEAHRSPSARLTCRAAQETSALTYAVTDLQATPSASGSDAPAGS